MTIKQLKDKFGLEGSDIVTTPDGVMIIRRPGIKKIQQKLDIRITLTVPFANETSCVVLALAEMPDETGVTLTSTSVIGSATPRNCNHDFPHETAEYRAVSRAVLDVSGLKSMNIMSEDEVGSQPAPQKPLSPLEELNARAVEVKKMGFFFDEDQSKCVMEEVDVVDHQSEEVSMSGVIYPLADVFMWSVEEHPYMTGTRTAENVKRVTKLLVSKGVSGVVPAMLADRYKDWHDMITKAPIIDLLWVIGAKKRGLF